MGRSAHEQEKGGPFWWRPLQAQPAVTSPSGPQAPHSGAGERKQSLGRGTELLTPGSCSNPASRGPGTRARLPAPLGLLLTPQPAPRGSGTDCWGRGTDPDPLGDDTCLPEAPREETMEGSPRRTWCLAHLSESSALPEKRVVTSRHPLLPTPRACRGWRWRLSLGLGTCPSCPETWSS